MRVYVRAAVIDEGDSQWVVALAEVVDEDGGDEFELCRIRAGVVILDEDQGKPLTEIPGVSDFVLSCNELLMRSIQREVGVTPKSIEVASGLPPGSTRSESSHN